MRKVEVEYNFLLVCPAYWELRRKYVNYTSIIIGMFLMNCLKLYLYVLIVVFKQLIFMLVWSLQKWLFVELHILNNAFLHTFYINQNITTDLSIQEVASFRTVYILYWTRVPKSELRCFCGNQSEIKVTLSRLKGFVRHSMFIMVNFR
jgi:hypothetical protein